jgi:uncharacterized membrane protein YdbT with pleckstrin-like domain
MIEFDSRPAWRDYFAKIVLGVLLLPVGIGLIVFLYIALDRYGTHYTIRHDRIQTREGIIAKRERSVRLENIRDLWLNQGIVDRILGIGTLGFSTSGGNGAEVVFRGIERPAVLKERIEEHLSRKESAST